MTVTQVPIDAGLFTWPADEPRLIGSRCTQCSLVMFPTQDGCARCGLPTATHLLPRRGTLYSFTTQGFLPKEPYKGPETPANFTPFGVGLVQLADEVRVEARLTEHDPSRLRFDMPVELVIVPFCTDDDGNDVMTFAFEPVD